MEFSLVLDLILRNLIMIRIISMPAKFVMNIDHMTSVIHNRNRTGSEKF
jgi:hypothetical protein